jgi:tetratricopeptide (TPR) repeat protein
MKTILFSALLSSILLLSSAIAGAQASNNNSLSVPEDARKHFVMGTTLFKDAKTADDFSQAEGEFKQATDLAPQWPDARYNLALTREAAGDYTGAMADLKLYQQFKLSEAEARTVQDKIYVLEAKQKKAATAAAAKDAAAKAKESSPQAVIAQKQNTFDDSIKKIDGRRYMGPEVNGGKTEINIRGKVLVRGLNINGQFQENGGGPGENSRIEIRGRETTVVPYRVWGGIVSRTYIISEDGERINERDRFNDGDVRETICGWQR